MATWGGPWSTCGVERVDRSDGVFVEKAGGGITGDRPWVGHGPAAFEFLRKNRKRGEGAKRRFATACAAMAAVDKQWPPQSISSDECPKG